MAPTTSRGSCIRGLPIGWSPEPCVLLGAESECGGGWRFVSRPPSAVAAKEPLAGPKLFHLVQPDQLAVLDPVDSHVTLGVDLPGPNAQRVDPAPLDFALSLVIESQQLAPLARVASLECEGADAVVACVLVVSLSRGGRRCREGHERREGPCESASGVHGARRGRR